MKTNIKNLIGKHFDIVVEYRNLQISLLITGILAEETDFEIGHFCNFGPPWPWSYRDIPWCITDYRRPTPNSVQMENLFVDEWTDIETGFISSTRSRPKTLADNTGILFMDSWRPGTSQISQQSKVQAHPASCWAASMCAFRWDLECHKDAAEGAATWATPTDSGQQGTRAGPRRTPPGCEWLMGWWPAGRDPARTLSWRWEASAARCHGESTAATLSQTAGTVEWTAGCRVNQD